MATSRKEAWERDIDAMLAEEEQHLEHEAAAQAADDEAAMRDMLEMQLYEEAQQVLPPGSLLSRVPRPLSRSSSSGLAGSHRTDGHDSSGHGHAEPTAACAGPSGGGNGGAEPTAAPPLPSCQMRP